MLLLVDNFTIRLQMRLKGCHRILTAQDRNASALQQPRKTQLLKGGLFDNFVVTEIVKSQFNKGKSANFFLAK